MITEKQSLYTDVTHTLGVPFGGFGTGFFVYGRHGFVKLNFDGFPETKQTREYPHGDEWDYLNDSPQEAPLALYAETDGVRTLLQTRQMSEISGASCRDFSMSVYMPFAHAVIDVGGGVAVRLLMYSSVKPHDLALSGVPGCVIEAEVENSSAQDKNVVLGLDFDRAAYTSENDGELLTLYDKSGSLCFGFDEGDDGKVGLFVGAGQTVSATAALGWYYPDFAPFGMSAGDAPRTDEKTGVDLGPYKREYTARFSSSADVAWTVLRCHQQWKEEILRWHGALKLPDEFLRLLFGSYASVITSTMYSRGGLYFEVEQPHSCLNTMDVSVYSTWLYMINWPEIERADLMQYVNAIPKDGENPGKVWHSLWSDGAHYVEEAIYVLRVWRYALWASDRAFLVSAFDSVRLAMEHIYSREGYGHLINNVEGNQSYDAWKMPGIGAYVNNQWLYALYSYRRICQTLGKPETLCGISLDIFIHEAVTEYEAQLWDEDGGYYHAYRPNEKSISLPFGDAVFTDQLFGHWTASLDSDSDLVLERDKEKRALEKIYTHNRIAEKERGYSCWVNGMLPERERTVDIDGSIKYPDDYSKCGYHALSCWVGTQMVLASMLGHMGMEKQSLDVFYSVAEGIGDNVLAAGEYNCAVNENLEGVLLMQEPGKDTPRFPPYPRYKSSWEYIARMLGLTMNFDTLTLSPFKTLDFAVEGLVVGKTRLDVRVESGWSVCYVNGIAAKPVLSREHEAVCVEFLRG